MRISKVVIVIITQQFHSFRMRHVVFVIAVEKKVLLAIKCAVQWLTPSVRESLLRVRASAVCAVARRKLNKANVQHWIETLHRQCICIRRFRPRKFGARSLDPQNRTKKNRRKVHSLEMQIGAARRIYYVVGVAKYWQW